MNRISRPAPGLEQFVRYYVTRQMRIPGASMVHPVTARAVPTIEFDFGEPITAFYCGRLEMRKSPRVIVVGPQTHRRVDLQLHGALESFNIMFQPDGLYRLFSIPMYELVDEDYEGHAALGAFISGAYQRLGECDSFEARVRFMDEALLRRAIAAPTYNAISAAANRVLSTGGGVSIAALAGHAGLSMRQFERKFIQQVGMRPKLFERIARFEAALDGKARFSAKSWTDVAHQFGYYDQMHMVHDFAEFTSETPTKTLTQLELVFGERISTVRSDSSCEPNGGNSRIFF